MKKLTLRRFANTPMGAFGSIAIPDGPTLYTCEDQWRNNVVGDSCIPAGVYKCKARPYYAKGYDAIEVTNVPGRSHILFHIGNTNVDTRGCILVGSALGYVKGQWAVTDSTNAFKNILMPWFDGEEFELEIIWDFPQQ